MTSQDAGLIFSVTTGHLAVIFFVLFGSPLYNSTDFNSESAMPPFHPTPAFWPELLLTSLFFLSLPFGVKDDGSPIQPWTNKEKRILKASLGFWVLVTIRISIGLASSFASAGPH